MRKLMKWSVVSVLTVVPAAAIAQAPLQVQDVRIKVSSFVFKADKSYSSLKPLTEKEKADKEKGIQPNYVSAPIINTRRLDGGKNEINDKWVKNILAKESGCALKAVNLMKEEQLRQFAEPRLTDLADSGRVISLHHVEMTTLIERNPMTDGSRADSVQFTFTPVWMVNIESLDADRVCQALAGEEGYLENDPVAEARMKEEDERAAELAAFPVTPVAELDAGFDGGSDAGSADGGVRKKKRKRITDGGVDDAGVADAGFDAGVVAQRKVPQIRKFNSAKCSLVESTKGSDNQVLIFSSNDQVSTWNVIKEGSKRDGGAEPIKFTGTSCDDKTKLEVASAKQRPQPPIAVEEVVKGKKKIVKKAAPVLLNPNSLSWELDLSSADLMKRLSEVASDASREEILKAIDEDLDRRIKRNEEKRDQRYKRSIEKRQQEAEEALDELTTRPVRQSSAEAS